MKKLILTLSALTLMTQAHASPLFKWAKGVGGSADDFANSIAVDASGNTYIAGSFKNVVDFDPGPGIYNLTSKGGSDVVVLKLDASGNFMWAQSIGGTADDESFAILTDASGNIYLSGTFEGTADFDPGSGTANFISAGGTDAFVTKLNASGNLVWTKTVGGSGDDAALALALDAAGNIYTAGNFRNMVDLDPGSGTDNKISLGMSDMFVLKLDASGSFMWAKAMGGLLEDNMSAIAIDASGNIYTTGSFSGMADFDPNSGTLNLSSNGLSDIFVSKLDASGNLAWAHNIGGLLDDNGSDLTVDASGNVYITGSFNTVVDFDPGSGNATLTALGGSDAFVLKMNTSGSLAWAKNMGGLLMDYANAITVDASGSVYVTGAFQGTGDFDPGSGLLNLFSVGMSDAFVARLDFSGNLLWAKNMGSTTDDYGTDVKTDASGNVYTTGAYSGTGDFDPGSGLFNLDAPGSGNDFYTQRLTEEGTFLEEDFAISMQLPYPNPGMGIYTFVLSTKANIEVYNANGQLVYQKLNEKGQNKIDITNQPTGLYFVKVNDPQEGIMEHHTLVKF